jgi:hypothetical protein
MHCHEKIQFADVIQVAGQTADTISDAIRVDARRLAGKNLIATVISSVKTSNETAMLNPADHSSIRARTRLPIHRIAYAAHTVNLARHEFVNNKNGRSAIAESLNSAYLSCAKADRRSSKISFDLLPHHGSRRAPSFMISLKVHQISRDI